MSPNLLITSSSGKTRKAKPKRWVKLAKPVQKAVKSQIMRNMETKHTFVSATAQGIDNTSPYQIWTLSAQAQGIGDDDMIGTKCVLRYLRINYTLTATNPIDTVRLIIFRDNEFSVNTDYDPNVLFQDYATLNQDCHYNTNLKARYKVLYDRRHTLSDTSGALVPSKSGKISLSLKSSKFQFVTNTSISGSQAKGHIYFLAFSNHAVAPYPIIRFHSKLTFKE